MPAAPFFWNRIANRYARQPVADEASYQHKLAVTRSFLRPEMEVLDFGAGTGTTALTLAPLVRRITAIDFSERMNAIARGKAAAAGIGNVDFQVATIEGWPAPDQSYDVALGMSILHLVEDLDAVLAKVRRLLRPGGRFISSSTCIGEMNPVARLILPLGHALRLLPLVRVFSKADLVAAHRQAGFEIEHDWQPAPKKAVFLVAKAP